MPSQAAREVLKGAVAMLAKQDDAGGSNHHRNHHNHWNLHGDEEESGDELRGLGVVAVVGDVDLHCCFGSLWVVWQLEELLCRKGPSRVQPHVSGNRNTPLGLKSEKGSTKYGLIWVAQLAHT